MENDKDKRLLSVRKSIWSGIKGLRDSWAAVTFLRVNHKRHETFQMKENHFSPGLYLLIMPEQPSGVEREKRFETGREDEDLCVFMHVRS